ncbi:hypothetical protein [Streptomyces sp. NPDC046925]|uniref:hypothetical protein n=1 Tax=Streptomyces sp. NPDC046925 TaxID=3155375 RepID=UPI00340603EF
MTAICRECDRDTADPVAVALEHAASAGGRVVYLCPPCRRLLGIMPLSEHPEGSHGFVRYVREHAP